MLKFNNNNRLPLKIKNYFNKISLYFFFLFTLQTKRKKKYPKERKTLAVFLRHHYRSAVFIFSAKLNLF